jgi:hypothetical protein
VSGERAGDRKIIEENKRDMVESGVKPAKAEQLARESMIRVDRKLREEGKR